MSRLGPILGLSCAVGLGAGAPAWAGVTVVDCVTGPHTDIDAAITASNPGDTILVHYCARGYPSFSLTNASNLRIAGVDSSGGVVGSFEAGVGATGAVPVFIDGRTTTCIDIDDSTDITIANLRLVRCDNGIEETGGIRNVMHGLAIDHPGGVGYLADGSEGSVFAGNVIVEPADTGIRVDGTTDQLVFDNVVMDALADGIELTDDINSSVLNNQVIQAVGDAIASSNSSDPGIDLNSTTALGSGILVVANTTNGELVGNESGAAITNNGTNTLDAENL